MKTNDILWPAVRAVERIWGPMAESMSEAERADAGFDGGEFSGSWHASNQQDRFGEVIGSVAARFGIAPAALDEMVQLAGYHNFDLWLRAQGVALVEGI